MEPEPEPENSTGDAPLVVIGPALLAVEAADKAVVVQLRDGEEDILAEARRAQHQEENLMSWKVSAGFLDLVEDEGEIEENRFIRAGSLAATDDDDDSSATGMKYLVEGTDQQYQMLARYIDEDDEEKAERAKEEAARCTAGDATTAPAVQEHKVDAAAEQLGALETELRALKPSALGRRARNTEGIDEGAMDAALDDDDDPKDALIRVMLAHAAKLAAAQVAAEALAAAQVAAEAPPSKHAATAAHRPAVLVAEGGKEFSIVECKDSELLATVLEDSGGDELRIEVPFSASIVDRLARLINGENFVDDADGGRIDTGAGDNGLLALFAACDFLMLRGEARARLRPVVLVAEGGEESPLLISTLRASSRYARASSPGLPSSAALHRRTNSRGATWR